MGKVVMYSSVSVDGPEAPFHFVDGTRRSPLRTVTHDRASGCVCASLSLDGHVVVAELLGHARLDTTRRCTLPTHADLEDAVGRLPTDR